MVHNDFTFYLHLKECEFRFNCRTKNLYKMLLKMFRGKPLFYSRPFYNIMMSYTNINEYRIVALQRSGHHAIINWINSNISKKICFLNCQPQGNPYTNLRMNDSIIGHIDIEEERIGNFSKKELLIYNFEDKPLATIYSASFLKNIEGWVGRSLRVKNILILRDPFNNFASKYKWAIHGTKWVPSLEKVKYLPAIWKTYAKEFLGKTNYISDTKLCINYNRWFTDPQYRTYLATEMGLATVDKGLKTVAKWGPNTWGDSFDNLNFDGRADKMKVLFRWAFFRNDVFYKSLFKDTELVELSKKIFGHIPGTDVLLQ